MDTINGVLLLSVGTFSFIAMIVVVCVIAIYTNLDYFCWDATPRNCFVAKYMTYDLPIEESMKYGWCVNQTVTVSQPFAIVNFDYGDGNNHILIPYVISPNPACNYSNPIIIPGIHLNTNITCYLDNWGTLFRIDKPYYNCENQYDGMYNVLITGGVAFLFFLSIYILSCVIIKCSKQKQKVQPTRLDEIESSSMSDAIE